MFSTVSSTVGSVGPPGSQRALTPLAVHAAAEHAAMPYPTTGRDVGSRCVRQYVDEELDDQRDRECHKEDDYPLAGLSEGVCASRTHVTLGGAKLKTQDSRTS